MSHTATLAPATSSNAAPFSQYLPMSELTCAPEPLYAHHEFHWLAYVAPNGKSAFPMRVECELWRWHQDEWRSVFVPGTRFTPEELHEHGWRYCKPCEPLVAVIRS